MTDLQKFGIVIVAAAAFVLYINLLCVIIAAWSGWRTLAERFYNPGELRQQVGTWQSARMRLGMHYNNALKVGADVSGLYLATIAIVPQHKPLLIPWQEIHSASRSSFWSFRFVTFKLGRLENLPFTISEKLAYQIQGSPGVPPLLIPHNE